MQQAELADGQNCLLRRVITSNGRSRAWINGSTVTMSQLQELGECLVEIHGQKFRLINDDCVRAVIEDPRGVKRV